MKHQKIKTIALTLIIAFNLCFGQFAFRLPEKKDDDSLKIAHKDVLLNTGYKPQKLRWNLTRTIGTSLMISFGVLSYYLDEQADKNYARYLETGDLEKMKKYYKKTKKYDRYKGISYIGIEIGFFINVWSLIKEN